MCVVIGKYFEDHGWVAYKNRDRNYIPDVSFKKKYKHGLEILYFWDNITQWCEGVNSSGIGVLSASLMVSDDEKEYVTCSETKPSKSGQKIYKTLKRDTVESAVEYAIHAKLTGNTLIFDQDNMYLLEGAWRPGEYATEGYYYEVRKINHTDHIVRTNHGIWLPNTGYQRIDDDPYQTFNRVSSESRLEIANNVAIQAETPINILDELTYDYTRNGQLNALRSATINNQMRTTSQLMIIPKDRTMYVRHVQGRMKFDYGQINHADSTTWLELLSVRIISAQKPAF